jgi:hypothetical protein
MGSVMGKTLLGPHPARVSLLGTFKACLLKAFGTFLDLETAKASEAGAFVRIGRQFAKEAYFARFKGGRSDD